MKFPFIKMNILQYLISNGKMTGYSFMQHCKARGIPVSNGTIYPHLKELEAAGIIQSSIDGKRKVYTITTYGEEWVKNSTNASMPAIFKQSILRFNRNLDLLDWKNPDKIKELANEMDALKQELESYAHQLEQRKGENK